MRALRPRGMTLVELIMAVAILTVVVTIAMSVVIAGANMSRNAEQQADSDDSARRAADVLSLQLHHAGLGAAGGLNAVIGGATVTVGAVLGVNSTTGPDELWVVTPVADVLGAGCDGAGNGGQQNAAAVVQESRTDGVIRVRCVNTLPAAGGLLMVTNLTSAALINVTSYNPTALGTDLVYDEAGQAGFTNNYRRGGFAAGDLVAPIAVRHYFIDPAGPRPRLMEARGALSNGGFPFVDVPGTAREVAEDIEDLQVSFGVDPTDGDDPSRVVWQHGLGGANGLWSPGLRSVNVAIVARSFRQYLASDGTGRQRLGPIAAADHDPNNPVPVPDDGHRRVLIERRIELPNAAPWNL